MAVTSDFLPSGTSVDIAGGAAAGRDAAKRRQFHVRRIRQAANPRSRRWQSTAWLQAELACHSDAEAARIARAFAAQLGRGETPNGDPLEEVPS